MDWKPYEPWLHRLGGFLTEALNLRLFWFWRERKQLPPATEKLPVMDTPIGQYWHSARVLDMLNDLEECAQGGTIGWLWPLAFGVLIGWGMWG
jgi:hypothetical protein